jgi:hypothetical protein
MRESHGDSNKQSKFVDDLVEKIVQSGKSCSITAQQPATSDGEEEEEDTMLADIDAILQVDSTKATTFVRMEKAVDADIEALADALGGTEMDKIHALVDVFELLTEKVQEEEDLMLLGDDDEDDVYHMDVMELSDMFEEMTMPHMVAARRLQAERRLKERLKQKAVALMFRKGMYNNHESVVQKYPDIYDKMDEILKQQGYGANARRSSTEAFGIARNGQDCNVKGAGYRGVHNELLKQGYKISYTTTIYLGRCKNKRSREAANYRAGVDMVMRRMVKRFSEDNVDRRYQMAQYDQFNTIVDTLKRQAGEVDVGIYQRDDHAVYRAGTGAMSNRRRILQQREHEVHEMTHDYAHAQMTKLQATAVHCYGLGEDADGLRIKDKQVVFTKALQITPSTPAQLMHDTYRMLEMPELRDNFYNADGSVKRVQHWRVDGGSNEAINSLLNRIYWVEYMERNAVDVLLVSHCESGGNVRELIERMQACITEAQAGRVLPYEKEAFADVETGALDEDKLNGYHTANNAKYASWIDNAPGLNGCNMVAKESHKQIGAALPRCPPHFFDRAPFFYDYFHSSTSAKQKAQLIENLEPHQKGWAKEAQHYLQLLTKHGKFGKSRYTLFLSRCVGGNARCPSSVCSSCEAWMCPDEWCEGGPPTHQTGVIFPQYDPNKEGHYMTPHALWDAHRKGLFRNVSDGLLPSALLKERWEVLTNKNKAKALTMSEAESVSLLVKDSYITPQRVFDYFKKQRLIHLRRVAGVAKKRMAKDDIAKAVPLSSRQRSSSTGGSSSNAATTSEAVPTNNTEALEVEEQEDRDPDWPYSKERAETQWSVQHYPTWEEAVTDLKLLHDSGAHAGKVKKTALVSKLILWNFEIEGWWCGTISSATGSDVFIKFKDDPNKAYKEQLDQNKYGSQWLFAAYS